MALKKYCPKCNQLINISQRYCEKHQQELEAKQKEYQKQYDKSVRYSRDKQYHDFYNSPEWNAVRLAAITRDHGLCVLCYKEKRITKYNTVHHIKPIKTPEGWRDRLSLSGVICVCEFHHQQLHKR